MSCNNKPDEYDFDDDDVLEKQKHSVQNRTPITKSTYVDVTDSDVITRTKCFLRDHVKLVRKLNESELTTIETWFNEEIQKERNAWHKRLGDTMREMERYRRISLEAQILIDNSELRRIDKAKQQTVSIQCVRIPNTHENAETPRVVKCDASNLERKCFCLLQEHQQIASKLQIHGTPSEGDCLKALDKIIGERKSEDQRTMDFEIQTTKICKHQRTEMQKLKDENERLSTEASQLRSLVRSMEKSHAGNLLSVLNISKLNGPANQQSAYSMPRHDKLQRTIDELKSVVNEKILKIETLQCDIQTLKRTHHSLENELFRREKTIEKYENFILAFKFNYARRKLPLIAPSSTVRHSKRMTELVAMRNSLQPASAEPASSPQNQLTGSLEGAGRSYAERKRRLAVREKQTAAADGAGSAVGVGGADGGASSGAGVARCARCGLLFSGKEDSYGCRYHGEIKEAAAADGADGVVWKCCGRAANDDGCCVGTHIAMNRDR